MAEATGGMTAELYQAIVAVVDDRVKEIRVTREDFHELKGVVQELAEAQRELAQAQVHTEHRLDRLEAVVEDLVQAQRELVQAQARTEQRLDELVQVQASFARTFDSKMGAIGARWGRDTEASFREGMRTILEDVGFKVERYLVYDGEGTVFDRPDQVLVSPFVEEDARKLALDIEIYTRADELARSGERS